MITNAITIISTMLIITLNTAVLTASAVILLMLITDSNTQYSEVPSTATGTYIIKEFFPVVTETFSSSDSSFCCAFSILDLTSGSSVISLSMRLSSIECAVTSPSSDTRTVKSSSLLFGDSASSFESSVTKISAVTTPIIFPSIFIGKP